MLTLALPQRTWAHALPAGLKLALLLVATLVIFPVRDPWAMAAVLATCAGLAATLGRIAVTQLLRSLRPLLFLLLIVLAYHIWQDRIAEGLVVTMRIFALVTLATFVTMTTRLDDLIRVVERLAAPLRHIGLPPRALALAIAMVIRFIPVILDRYERLSDAWRARSPRGPRARILAPLVLSILDDAEQVSDALTARGGLVSQPDPERTS